MSLSIDDLTEPLTVDEAKESIYSVLALTGVDVTNWKPGAVVRTIIAGFAIVLSALSSLIAVGTRSGFLALSSGDWLTLVARYVYNVERILATAASGTVTLVNSSGANYTVSAGDLIVSSSITGKQYHNTAGFTLNALSSLTVDITAIELGSASTAFIGEIDTMVTLLTGVTCSNPVALIGTDAEDDEALKTRCSEKLGSLSPFGPQDAYNFAARNALRTDGTNVGVTRVRTVKDTAGNVTVYVANASGGITGTPTTGDLKAVNDAIQKNAAPLGITASVVSATALPIAITYELWLYNTSGLEVSEIAQNILTALTNFLSKEPIGGDVVDVLPGKLYKNKIIAIIGGAVPGIFRIDLTVPASDTSLNIFDVPIIGAVTVTDIHQVTSPGQ